MKKILTVPGILFISLGIILSSHVLFSEGRPAARKDDRTAHGGSIIHGCNTVMIGGRPAARMDDYHTCPMVIPPGIPHVGGAIFSGSQSVIIGGKRAARVGDQATCQNGSLDTIITGCPTVLIGD